MASSRKRVALYTMRLPSTVDFACNDLGWDGNHYDSAHVTIYEKTAFLIHDVEKHRKNYGIQTICGSLLMKGYYTRLPY